MGLVADVVSRLADAVSPVMTLVAPDTLGATALAASSLRSVSVLASQASALRNALAGGLLGGRLPLEKQEDARAVVDAVNGVPEADTLLFENLIACYANGDLWYRPHEAIVDTVARLSGESGGG